MRESTEIRLVVTSATITAKDLEARLGVKPDDSWVAGEERGTFKNKEKFHGFVLESGAPHLPFNEQLRALIKRLASCAVKLGELAPHLKAQVQCRLQRKQVPPLDFERDDLRWLAAMGAGLEVDVTVEAPPPPPAAKAGGDKPSTPSF
ncbi:MAG: DUF4279 domain-containing protein [Elusimicrobiota bacterium]|nr:DUF4279 domain-containing protein [Elusimicrobiota bacterium]